MTDQDDPTLGMLRAILQADPGLRAALHDALGVPPWPYDDLTLRCPNCPVCGTAATMMVGLNLHPQAFCPNDACGAFTYDPTKPALDLLRDAGQLVAHETEHGVVYRVPDADVEYGVRFGGGRVWVAEDATNQREWAEEFATSTGGTLVRRTSQDGTVWHAVPAEADG